MDVLRGAPADRALAVLHSGRLHERWARWSLVAQPVGALRHFAGRTSWESLCGPCEASPRFTGHPMDGLDFLERRLEACRDGAAAPCGEAPWRGGWIGYLSYDLGRFIEPRAAAPGRLRTIGSEDWPLYEWLWCPRIFVYDRLDERWRCADLSGAVSVSEDEVREQLGLGAAPPAIDDGQAPLQPWRPRQSDDDVLGAVARTVEYIRAGDVFQANIARQFESSLRVDPRRLAAEAWRGAANWYGAYLETSEQRRVLSLSPELFLDVDRASRSIITRPLKGTRRSSQHRDVLEASDKDAAELNMIVDLMRNDLGRVCEFGSVRVTQRRAVESHPTVHHGVATVEGRLRAGVGFAEVLRAAFPAGSITGAPKIRAMQIIDELEPFVRGPYCGSIGYVGPDRFCLNVAIRTILIQGERATYGAGAGVVADSDPASEVEEMAAKAVAAQRLTEQPLESRSGGFETADGDE